MVSKADSQTALTLLLARELMGRAGLPTDLWQVVVGSAHGIEPGRLALLIAVLERRARVHLVTHEVFTSVVGGVRLNEPGADLAVCLALVSSLTDTPLAPDLVVFGEIGLAGEARQAAHTARRVAEAARMGFARAIVPANAPAVDAPIRLLRVASLTEALAAAGLPT